MAHNYKEGEGVIMSNNIAYTYDKFYDRLECSEVNDIMILCPNCHNSTFSIKYSSYQCIAVCKCGHEMTVYDG